MGANLPVMVLTDGKPLATAPVLFLPISLKIHIVHHTNPGPATDLKLQPPGFLHLHSAPHPPD